MQTIHIVILLVLFGIILAALVRLLPARQGQGYTYAPLPIMTENEIEFFMRLTKACPKVYIFPQVGLSALIKPTGQKGETYKARNQISQKRVDYVLYTHDWAIICVIELDDKTHDSERDQKRDQMLASAGIKTIRWDSRRKPSESDIQKELSLLQSK